MSLVRLSFLALLPALALAKVPGAADPYAADRTDPGAIRLWGDPAMERLCRRWEEGYRRDHPEMRFEHRLANTAIGLPGIYLGLADVAVLGREMTVEDHDGFAHVRAYEPTRVEVATGSLAAEGKSPALVAFVSAGNPLRRLTLRQLDAAFGAERLRGGAAIRRWSDVGVTGPQAGHPIHLYCPDLTTGTGRYFLKAVLRGSHKLDWDRLTEGADNAALLRRLAQDPDGLAVATAVGAPAGVTPVALAVEEGGPFVAPSAATLRSRAYPLARAVLFFVNRRPGRKLDPKTAAFLRFVLSPQGQAMAAREGDFLPLEPELAREMASAL